MRGSSEFPEFVRYPRYLLNAELATKETIAKFKKEVNSVETKLQEPLREKVDEFIGAFQKPDLSYIQQRALLGILALFSREGYKNSEIAFSKSQFYKACFAGNSGNEKQLLMKALHSLSKTRVVLLFKKYSKGEKRELRTANITFEPIISIGYLPKNIEEAARQYALDKIQKIKNNNSTYYSAWDQREKEEEDKYYQKRLRGLKGKKEELESEKKRLDSVFVCLNTPSEFQESVRSFVSIPINLFESFKSKSKFTPRFIKCLLRQMKTKKNSATITFNNQEIEVIEWGITKKKLAKILGMDNYVKTRNEKRRNETLHNAYEEAKNIGILIDYKEDVPAKTIGGEKDIFYINPDKTLSSSKTEIMDLESWMEEN